MLAEKRAEEVNKLKEIVENPDFKVTADVEIFFEAYTKYIWDYKMVGAIYDCYCDNIEIKLENGENLVGIEAEVRSTLTLLNAFPDLRISFIDIFAHKVAEDEFQFVQITHLDATSLGPSRLGPPTGKKLTYDNMMEMCECLVKKVNGQWKIVDEWVSNSNKRIDSVMRGYEF